VDTGKELRGSWPQRQSLIGEPNKAEQGDLIQMPRMNRSQIPIVEWFVPHHPVQNSLASPLNPSPSDPAGRCEYGEQKAPANYIND
jgi:hypothetical protein